jgi:CDP-diacylglycerol--glycerol-3-phosphate 3-phosphatidyltransferase
MQLDNEKEWEIDNLPNRLTLFRVILIPIIVGSLTVIDMDWAWAQNRVSFFSYLAGWTFVLASITDFFDGYIARKRNIVTVFGSFLDPVADKFLVVSSLILLLALDRIHVLIVVVLVLREMYITALRLLATERGLSVPVGQLGKWKTATQMVAIPMLMAYDKPFGGLISFPLLGNIFISLACFFSVYSALEYSFGLVAKIKAARKQKKELKKMKKDKGQDGDQ